MTKYVKVRYISTQTLYMHLFCSNVLSCQTFWFARHIRVQMKVHMGTHTHWRQASLLILTVWSIWEAFLIPPCPSDPTELSAPRPPGGNYSGPKTPNGPKVKIVKILTLLFSCPEQLNRWPCHSLTESVIFRCASISWIGYESDWHIIFSWDIKSMS